MVCSVFPRPCNGVSRECYSRGECSNHLVCEDTVQTIMVEGDHPVQALKLIVTHFAMNIWTEGH